MSTSLAGYASLNMIWCERGIYIYGPRDYIYIWVSGYKILSEFRVLFRLCITIP